MGLSVTYLPQGSRETLGPPEHLDARPVHEPQQMAAGASPGPSVGIPQPPPSPQDYAHTVGLFPEAALSAALSFLQKSLCH